MIISLTSTSNRFHPSWRFGFSVTFNLFPAKYFCLLLAVLISSCEERGKPGSVREENKPAYRNPVSVLLDTMPPPRVTYLKDVPPPVVLQIPESQIGLNKMQIENDGKRNKSNLSPGKLVGVPIPHFTNINTEQGLPKHGGTKGNCERCRA